MKIVVYSRFKCSFVKKEVEMLSDYVCYEPRSCEYLLTNGKEVFAREYYDNIVQWCKDTGLFDWYVPMDNGNCIRPDIPVMYFAFMVLQNMDLNLMTDAHVLRSCVRRCLAD